MMLLPKQLRTLPQSMQQPGQWAAHLIRGVDMPVACYTCTGTLGQIYQRKKVLEQKTNRKRKKYRRKGKKEGGKEGRKEGKKEGRKEGRKERRKEDGRKKETKDSSKMLRALSHVHMLLSKSCRSQAICKCWFQNVAKTVQFTDVSRNMLQTPCNVVLSADDNFKMLRIPSTCRFELQKAVKM